MPDPSDSRPFARDLKPGNRFWWNGRALTVERIEVRSAPWVSGGAQEAFVGVAELVGPPLIIAANVEVRRA